MVGFDIEAHEYGDQKYPGELILRDVRSIHGSQLKDAAVIVATDNRSTDQVRADVFADLENPVSEDEFQAAMQETGEKFDPKAYLPAITGYYSTSKGEMLSFPFNSSSMVMWVNLDALKKADIAEIPKIWPELFEDAKKLKAAGYADLRAEQLRPERYDYGPDPYAAYRAIRDRNAPALAR